MVVGVQKRILLLNAEPWLLVRALIHGFLASFTFIRLVRLPVPGVSFTHHELVRSSEERIFEHCNGVEINVGVHAFGLGGRGPIEVPDREV